MFILLSSLASSPSSVEHITQHAPDVPSPPGPASKMLSLHPQDFNSNPCYLPYRSFAGPAITAEHSTFVPFTMGGAVQPPTPQHEDHMEMDGPAEPLSPRTSPAHQHTSSQQQQQQQQRSASPRTSPAVQPPSDFGSLDPNTVAEALEIARDSPDGARDPVVSGILESALTQLWDRVTAQPETYVMSTGEFAVFNFYQHRFVGNKLAVAARRRFWDNTHA